tara:strand:+ start:9046 stop:10500 length:1455 start_codon:yes stop_codon:yes gene_type:complete
MKKIIPIILCGGVGSRLWPLSREGRPKPFIKLKDNETLLEKTYRRISKLKNLIEINGKPFALTITNLDYFFLCKDEAKKFNLHTKFILEPQAKNTAPAIVFATSWIKKNFLDSNILVVPADHLINDDKGFCKTIDRGLSCLNMDSQKIITFGINPTSADTNYGYIEKSNLIKNCGFTVKKFHEKPNKSKAQIYFKSSKYFWNSGISLFYNDTLITEIKKFQPSLLTISNNILKQIDKIDNFNNEKILLPDDEFSKYDSISIDYALFEKSNNINVIEADFDWSDIGNWSAFIENYEKDSNDNTIQGSGIFFKSKNSFIQSSKNNFIAAVGVSNLIVIDTKDALLIIDKNHIHDIKLVLEKLKEEKKDILTTHLTSKRPWGKYTIIEQTESYKIKMIEVKPKHSLSLQSHKFRSEHWIVIDGKAKVQNNEAEYIVNKNESTFIAKKSKHRLSNPSNKKPLIIIEVQSGSYLGENDIKRYEDDFGRA